MKRLGWLCSLALLPAQEPVRARLTIESSRLSGYVGEALSVRLRIAIDREFFATSAIQPFQQRLDIPLQIRAPWLGELRDGELLPAVSTGTATFALGDRTTTAVAGPDAVQDGRTFAVWTHELRLLVRRAGTFELAAPTLHYSWASRFRESLLSGREPEDRHDERVAAAPLVFEVKPLPALGRPADFGGAIGVFAVIAELQPRVLEVGQTGKLSLRVRGDGDLRFAAPAAPVIPGCEVLGMLASTRPGERTFTWDLVPRSGISAVPPLRLPVFDPMAGAFVVLATEPVPVTVHGASAPSVPVAVPTPGLHPLWSKEQILGHALPVTTASLLVAFALPWVLAAVVFWWRRQQARRAADPLGERAHGAAAAFGAAMARGDDRAQAFTAYLAARLRCTEASVVGPDLAARLQHAGVSLPLAERAAGLFDAFTAARYGGAAAGADVQALVHELEPAFAAAEAKR